MRNITRARLIVLQVLVISLLGTLVGRLYELQVRDAGTYQNAARDNQVRDIITQPPRGLIVDDKGHALIDNVSALVVKVDRTVLQRLPAETQTVVLRRLARALQTTPVSLQDQIRVCDATTPKPCWNGSPYEPVPVSQVKSDAKATDRALMIEQNLDQYDKVVTVVEQPVRHYPEPDGALASTVLGYLAPITPAALKKLPLDEQLADTNAYVGASGLEESYEKYLHGTPGLKQVAVDAQGNPTGQLKYTPPRAGDTLVTNLDAKVQAKLEQSLHTAIVQQRSEGQKADFAAGVVMNVRTGGIVAMASEPTYKPDFFDSDPTQKAYRQLEHETGSPTFDKAYGSATPPGSTFKMITASGALKDGIINTGTQLQCLSTFQTRSNYDGESSGYESLHEAIVKSCDTWFYQVGFRDWTRDYDRQHGNPPKPVIEGVQHMAADFGLGKNPDIDLPNAASGYIPDRKSQLAFWKDYERRNACAGAKRRKLGTTDQADDAQACKYGYIFEPGDQENEDTGQGQVTVSPLQLAVAYAAIANGGKVWEPRVAKAILSPSGKLIKRIHAKVRDRIPVSAADQDYIRSALHGVTTEAGGTATSHFADWPMSRISISGKTGTAELPHDTAHGDNGCWFASYAGKPGKTPQFVTIIELDRGTQGADAAAPAAVSVWKAIYGVGEKSIFNDGNPPKGLPNLELASANSVRTKKSRHHHHTEHKGGKH